MSDEGSAQRARNSTNPLKILIVGEGAVGKTSLCSVFRLYRELDKEEPPSEEDIRALLSMYEPTIFENDNYTTTVLQRSKSTGHLDILVRFYLFRFIIDMLKENLLSVLVKEVIPL